MKRKSPAHKARDILSAMAAGLVSVDEGSEAINEIRDSLALSVGRSMCRLEVLASKAGKSK